jgi:hypothetical protein
MAAVPWELTGPAEPGWLEDPGFKFYEVHGADGDLVALVAGEANARLIVAQSDLLAALEAVVDSYPKGDWLAAIDDARAAIVKAKGI